MVQIDMLWLIVNLVMAILLAVLTLSYFNNSVSAVCRSLFLLTLEIVICLIPWVTPLTPYFQGLTSGVGAPILLMVLACFYFGSLSNFCGAGWQGCYGSVIGCVVFVVCIVELVFKKDQALAVGQAAGQKGKKYANEGVAELRKIGVQKSGETVENAHPCEQVIELPE
ncbi:Transmembrane domain-containing protein [Spironucleus salmonicida]|uniref:Transmembrane domain-containing protein n=1 Tax=Spironucleus salmonicida TaxID=348837 RepID=V6LD50_9EUKA|nr:Transmembrane domain-containing protein [Spironucleus salmonicida]|eukprot:EST41606.1 Transmembrane domain-containing protein [Spironucleus salmonicida]